MFFKPYITYLLQIQIQPHVIIIAHKKTDSFLDKPHNEKNLKQFMYMDQNGTPGYFILS